MFLAAIDGTAPLAGRERDRIAVPPPPSTVRVVELPPAVSLTVDGDSQRYSARAPGVSRAQVTELRQGRVRVEQTLDLHGETVERGLAMLRELCVGAAGKRCVLVVHGKGLHSEHGAPLREAVLAELLGPLSGFVHALATAAPADGGEGATYIMLRGPK